MQPRVEINLPDQQWGTRLQTRLVITPERAIMVMVDTVDNRSYPCDLTRTQLIGLAEFINNNIGLLQEKGERDG